VAGFEIILVDSNADRRGRIEAALVGSGYSVSAADSNQGAKELIQSHGEALLVTDLMLQDGNAFSLASERTAAGKLVVGLTDIFLGDSNRRNLVERLGLVDLLPQTDDPEQLIDSLQRLPIRPQTSVTGEVVAIGTTQPDITVPKALDPDAVPLSGTLEDHDIVAVLAHLAISSANGALMLQTEHVKKLVYFTDGCPVGVKSNRTDEFLGNMLVRQGVISQETCDSSVREMQETGRHQGEILVESGALDPGQLEEALHQQFLMKFEEVLAWEIGVYRYRDSAIPPSYFNVLPSDPGHLLWYGVDRNQPFERAQNRLWPVMDYTIFWRGQGIDVANLPYPQYAAELFERLDGSCSTKSAVAGLSDPDHALMLLYTLTAFGSVAYQSNRS